MDLKFADIPNGLAAIGKVPVAGWAQILAYMAFCEISQKQIPGTPAYDGDFGWKVITSDDAEIKKKKLNSEIANGRLAMMGIIGLFFQDGLTGSPWGYWAGNPSSFWKARGLAAIPGVSLRWCRTASPRLLLEPFRPQASGGLRERARRPGTGGFLGSRRPEPLR